MPTIRLENLELQYQNEKKQIAPGLNGFSCVFENEKINILMGPSGSGKTTVLNTICGIIPYDGHIYFDDILIDDIPIKNRNIGFVRQDSLLFPNMTVFNNLAFPLKNLGASSDEITSRIKEISTRFGFYNLLTRFPKELSGGQQQKVALAKTLIKDPKVILFDEPLAHIDEPSRLEFLKIFNEEIKAKNLTCIYSTHNLNEALNIGEHFYIIEDGKLQFSGDLEGFLSYGKHQ